ncbi:Metallo-dependent hydrolase [Marasmius fiardii PR-910]|nr:Metallo-dependent hydrolase [Marasmius fiardii PR-910]
MLYKGSFVHCPQLGELELLYDHLLAVDEFGFIEHLEPSDSPNSRQYLDTHSPQDLTVLKPGSFLLPNFCDLHLHAPQFLYQGNGLHLPLMQWLGEYAFKAEEKLDSDPTLARKVYSSLANRLIEHGTGAVMLFGTIGEETNLILADVLAKAGLRAFVGKLSMDISTRPSYVENSTEESLAAIASFTEKLKEMNSHLPVHRRLIEAVVTPRFVPTCSNELLRGLGNYAQEQSLRIQSHLAEAHDQVDWVRRERGVEDIEVFEENNLLTPRTVQAHCTFLDRPSLHRIHGHRTAIAHCPLSNAYFSAEPFRLREALTVGVTVGLGTDIAGGYSIDIMSAMRQAVVVSRMREGVRTMGNISSPENLAIDWKEALYLATCGGAKALGLPKGAGTFQVGAPFDAQYIELLKTEPCRGVGSFDIFDLELGGRETDVPSEDMVEKWWCLGDSRNRLAMWVQGVKLSPISVHS